MSLIVPRPISTHPATPVPEWKTSEDLLRELPELLRALYTEHSRNLAAVQQLLLAHPGWRDERTAKFLRAMDSHVSLERAKQGLTGDVLTLIAPGYADWTSVANPGVGGVVPSSYVAHALLDGLQDNDTVAHAPLRGYLVKGNSTPLWDRFAPGTSLQYLRVNAAGTDLEYATLSVTNVLLDGANHTDTALATPATGDLIVRGAGGLWDVLSCPAGNDQFLKSSGGAPGYSGALGKTGAAKVTTSTTQAADIATTTLLAASHSAGVYRVSVVLEDTTADLTAGAVNVTIGWTDDVGAATANPTPDVGTFPLVLTSTGRAAGGVTLYSTGAAAITYATSHTGIFGTAKYALRVRMEFLG